MCGRQLHLAKCFMIYFVPIFATEEGPFGAETFCQVKLSTMCLMLKSQQIPKLEVVVSRVQSRHDGASYHSLLNVEFLTNQSTLRECVRIERESLSISLEGLLQVYMLSLSSSSPPFLPPPLPLFLLPSLSSSSPLSLPPPLPLFLLPSLSSSSFLSSTPSPSPPPPSLPLTERLFDAKKQKLLLAFTGEQRELAQTPVDGAEEPRVELVAPPPSVAVVRYSSGDKCCVRVEEVSQSPIGACVCCLCMCVPSLQSWGAVNVLNAMVLSVPEDSDMVRGEG